MEGIIKIYWGTEASVRLKEYDDTRLIRQRKTVSVAPDFVNFQDEEKDGLEEDEDEKNSESLPYFNPRTHPLFRESIGELNKTTTDPFYSIFLDDREMMEDVENDNLLGYDPIQKWKTLLSLVDSSDECSDNSNNITVEDQDVVDARPAEKLARSSSVSGEKSPEKNLILMEKKSSTLPSKLTEIRDDLDDLLQVERKIEDHERVYHTVTSQLPLLSNGDIASPEKDEETDQRNNNSALAVESQHTEQTKSGKIFRVEKLTEAEDSTDNSQQEVAFRLGVYQDRKPVMRQATVQSQEDNSEATVKIRSKGPRALRRRHGKRMDKTKLRRRSSINGHWYDRDTSVFRPPKHTPMCVYTSSKMNSSEVSARADHISIVLIAAVLSRLSQLCWISTK